MNKGLFAILLPWALSAQAPVPGRLAPPNPHKQVLISSLSVPLSDPEVLEASAALRQALPAWKLSPVRKAAKAVIPRPSVTICCIVETGEGAEVWEFSFERGRSGRMRLRTARSL